MSARRWAAMAAVCGTIAATAVVAAPPVPATAATLPAGFTEQVVWSGLTQPTAVRFAPDGKVFVAEKSGIVKIFDGLTDPTPTVFADLRTNVFDGWDRGLLGLAVDPQYPTRPYVYVLYAYDQDPNNPSVVPRWNDACSDWTGAGCVVMGRLSRLTANGDVMSGPEQVLVTDWCQQFPSHSVGDLVFGRDGSLYASAGDGASFNYVDYGQAGNPRNPCGDPPTGVGGTQVTPTAEGGALRSQDVRLGTDAVGLDGTVIRIDPATGAGSPGNPLASSGDANARRIVASGLRNPYRLATRPGTDEVWISETGWNAWEEVNRITVGNDATMENFGWPCFEGTPRQSGYQVLNGCTSLSDSAVTAPALAWSHSAQVVPGEPCPTGSSSSTGIAFYGGGTYPAAYQGALFWADYSRSCIWVSFPGANGLPNPANVATFAAGAAGVVDLEIGPGGDLYYVDLSGGRVVRIVYSAGNRPPTAVASATPSSGAAPLAVTLSATGSSDPDANDVLSYSWDLDGNGSYADALGVTANRTYTTSTLVGLRVTDSYGASATTTVSVTVGNDAPTAAIASPAAGATWAVGDTIAFSGGAIDPQQGTLPPGSLVWELRLQHCPDNVCHTHVVQTWSGVASGSFVAPDHSYPSYLQLVLTATDGAGLTSVAVRDLQPRTVALSVATAPSGGTVNVNGTDVVTPGVVTLIANGTATVSAPETQTIGGQSATFAGWSDGGARTHAVTVSAATTLTATYTTTPVSCAAGEFRAEYFANMALSGSPVLVRCESTPNTDWGTGGPGAPVPVDGFSARWTGAVSLSAGTYRFTTTSDDGVRLRVNGALVIDNWTDHAPTVNAADATLTAGTHPVVLEFYENGGGAVARLSWALVSGPPASCPVGQFRAEYFNNRTLSGTPALVRCEATPNYTWGTGGPGAGVTNDNFSARWTGTVSLAARRYTFRTVSDDGVRLRLDGALVIDNWTLHSATTNSARRTVTAGNHTLVLEFFEATGSAVAQLSWS